MKKRHLGNTAVLILIGLYLLLWFITLPEILAHEAWREPFGEILAGVAMICMTLGLILATRLRFLEDFFGGLDKMYVTHRWLNTAALLLLIVHFINFFNLPPDQPGLVLGVIAFFGIFILAGLSLVPRIPVLKNIIKLPYFVWHYSHRLIGIFFIIGLVHFLWMEPISLEYAQGQFMYYFAFVGVAAYLYKQLIARIYWLGKPHEITAVTPLNASTLEITLQPQKGKIQHNAGQFMFVQFQDGDLLLAEPHPFTISSAPHEDALRLSIKSSGDWTKTLREKLKVGGRAKVQGGYGRFNYKTAGQHQVWIAGGIGVTPFLSWLRSLDGDLDRQVDFFYCVRTQADALFWEEIAKIGAENEKLSVHLHLSSANGRLSATQIAKTIDGDAKERDVFMCGPAAMITGYSQQFKALGLTVGQIHYEEFNFR